MKVLLLQKMGGISGSERYHLAILPELRRRGVDARFLVVQHPRDAPKNAPFVEQLERDGVPYDVIESRLPMSPALIVRLHRYLSRHRFDLVQTNLIHADVWGACVKRLFMPRLALVSLKHGYSESYQAAHGLDPTHLEIDAWSLLTRWSARSMERVTSISAGLDSFLVEGGLVKRAISGVVPYGFDFAGARSDVPAGGLRFGHPQILVTGRLVAVKQHHLLLGVLPALVEELPDLRVVMVGDGSLRDELAARATALGLQDHVRWEGFRPNVHDYIRDSDVMVIPSSAEGFGLVVLEAWYHARPVVAFDVPAINEVVEDGVDGILVAPFDTTSLLAALRELLADPARMRRLGEAGQRKQRAEYSLRTMCDRTIATYQSVLAGTARSS
jgi:glycosyltransferase involved in cell wall biosynthesis